MPILRTRIYIRSVRNNSFDGIDQIATVGGRSDIETQSPKRSSGQDRSVLSCSKCGGIIGFMDYESIIAVEPGKRGGKPCIRGLRITVYDILEYLASGMSEDDILRDFPDLTREDIRASLAFAADRERKLEISNA